MVVMIIMMLLVIMLEDDANEDSDHNTKIVPISEKWSAEEGAECLIIKIIALIMIVL